MIDYKTFALRWLQWRSNTWRALALWATDRAENCRDRVQQLIGR